MKELSFRTASNHGGTFSIPPSDHVLTLVLATGGSAETITVPAGAKHAIFSCPGGKDFYAKSNGAATVPTADVTDGSGSFPNPALWAVDAGDTIGVVGPENNTIVAVAFYS